MRSIFGGRIFEVILTPYSLEGAERGNERNSTIAVPFAEVKRVLSAKKRSTSCGQIPVDKSHCHH
jgi:hypothetical protein